ncbi:bioH protein [Shewanella denitrificans OS217]|jgi:pimeloyl-[acyl-carrier protein] methyl ester esterase|uniref:Pimeloyl-[acyl-carrier protein] methyl ester esterase n=1 Tax=Shewanella denitrificans (strain OS217 / ATCC BAA-1090 / DSM 15013) TaxID=318161 RepID=Q12IC1_SHEDO|nr:pimeloyl-ACP methyl ester esterase BioH [Shewanella denitrificans]ABE56805.1 bioH protein [Shewanella denitrificans OS217]
MNNVNKAKLHVEVQGQGADLVVLHGWGVNNAVFSSLKHELADYRVHYVDLPGFGHSPSIDGDINAWVEALVSALPSSAIWLGWSLGGLVAKQAAISYPDKVRALVTVASSPCFMAREIENWPGIAPKVLAQFSSQLGSNLPKTLDRFLAIQAMGSDTMKQDLTELKQLLLDKPLPQAQALEQGLAMLAQVDLRQELAKISQPWLRFWGRLDGLVPQKIQAHLPHGSQIEDVIQHKASHAPFISHQQEFSQHLLTWLAKQQ